MPAVEDVQFDTTGWQSVADVPENRRAWENARGDLLTLRFSPKTPKFPSLYHPQALREYYNRRVGASGGCVLSFDLLHVKGVAIGRLLFKSPKDGGGWLYMGSLNLAYQSFYYSLRMQSVERSKDQDRGQYVWDWLHDTQGPDADCLALWFGNQEPAEANVAVPCLADDVQWDPNFPDHPLSRIRAELCRIIPTLNVSRDVKNSQPHRG